MFLSLCRNEPCVSISHYRISVYQRHVRFLFFHLDHPFPPQQNFLHPGIYYIFPGLVIVIALMAISWKRCQARHLGKFGPRKQINCTDIDADLDQSCWATLNLTNWLNDWSPPMCGGRDQGVNCCDTVEEWSSCFLKLGLHSGRMAPKEGLAPAMLVREGNAHVNITQATVAQSSVPILALTDHN